MSMPDESTTIAAAFQSWPGFVGEPWAALEAPLASPLWAGPSGSLPHHSEVASVSEACYGPVLLHNHCHDLVSFALEAGSCVAYPGLELEDDLDHLILLPLPSNTGIRKVFFKTLFSLSILS